MTTTKRDQINIRIDPKTKQALSLIATMKRITYSEAIRRMIISEARLRGIWK